jgi:hypothetical protein
LAVVFCSAFAFSGPIAREDIPSNAQWIVHVDADAFRTSELGTLLLQNIPEEHKVKIDAMTQLLGTDITKDIHGITVFGFGPGEENATALFYGKFDKQKLLALLALNESYSESKYNDQSLYYWTDKKSGKKQVGAFAADNLIVIGQQESNIIVTLDVLSGIIEPLSAKMDLPLYKMTTVPSKTIFLAAAQGMSDLIQDNEHAAVLKKSKNLAVTCSETDGDMTLDIHLEVLDEATATQIEQIVRGMLAFAMIQQEGNPELAELLTTVILTREGTSLDLHIQYPSTKLYEIAKLHADTAVRFKTREPSDETTEP